MKCLLLSFAVAVMTLVMVHTDVKADGHPQRQAARRAAVHVGHVGPYCVFYLGKQGRVSPYRYSYNSWRYPRYYGGTHARVMQRVGVSPADVGIRDQAW